MGQLDVICLMLSSCGHKAQHLLSCQFLLMTLSLVRIALLSISHIQILIFRGILAFQIFLLWGFRKIPTQIIIDEFYRILFFFSHFQMGLSLTGLMGTVLIISLSCLKSFCWFSHNHLLKDRAQSHYTLFATEQDCSLHMLKISENLSLSVADPHQGSLQK